MNRWNNQRRGRTNMNLKNQELTSSKPRAKQQAASNNGHGKRVLVPEHEVLALQQQWRTDPGWHGVTRNYSAEKVLGLRGTMKIEYTIADRMSRKLWHLLNSEPYVNALGALTGNQAVQMVKAGLEAIYLSGWQVAADNNLSGHMYPDQSLYPANSVPNVVKRINQALQRADQIQHQEGSGDTYWFAPIVADAEVVWCETSHPDLTEARQFAEAVQAEFPGKLLAYNCSPSFNWKKKLDETTIARFQRELGAMGYKFQFVTLAGFHAVNHTMFELARNYRDRGMSAY